MRGSWEFLSNEAVLKYVDKTWKQKGRAEDACKSICVQAVLQWRQHEGDYRDDITAFVVHLPSIISALTDELGAAGDAASGA